MPSSPASPATLLVIFGASGDLAQRMLLPSLYGLQHAGLLPAPLRILGTARSELDDGAFRAAVAEAVRRQVPAADLDEASLAALLARMVYHPADSGNADSMRALGERIASLRNGDVLYHLSTAPRWIATEPGVGLRFLG